MVKYPEITVDLSDEDGNIFFIMGRVTKALRRGGVPQNKIKEFTEELMRSPSYDAALRVVMQWVSWN